MSFEGQVLSKETHTNFPFIYANRSEIKKPKDVLDF